MSMSMMKRTAPLTLLYCGVQNGGGGVGRVSGVNGVSGVSRFSASVQTCSPKREEELDGYTEDADGWTVKTVMRESRLQLQDSGSGELIIPDLEKETRELLSQFYRSYTGLKYRGDKRHPALPSLHRVVENVICKHKIAYNGMVQRLFNQANGLESVNSVLKGVFGDGVISWGRITSVLALGAMVCERLKQDLVKEQAEECVDTVASHISAYLSTDLQHWFITNNGWDGFVDFFRVEDPESTVRNTLMAVAGLGIGACLISLMR